MSKYVFPGVWPFIEARARETGRDLHQAGRTRSLWHMAQIQDSLGQLPRLAPADRLELIRHVYHCRESLALALEGTDAAIRAASEACGLPPAPWEPVPEAEPVPEPVPEAEPVPTPGRRKAGPESRP